ncbi:signal transduction histidine kinase [Leucobacter luti]|uniref:sensor histidine kinase n=1 Tax=Leucobacter luti TaxID=340320 RepID=UPI00104996A5|nr:ATP-binding protein [Leucobacter luti]MCW2289724.1 signal transduction histidine kinase [Leucobacter luti]TCK37894.1 signal transduction histidine kinase [Leucobacter luti]
MSALDQDRGFLIRIGAFFSPLVADLRPADASWASRSLLSSIREVMLGMIAVWQLVMVLAAGVSVGWSAWPVMVGNLGLAAAAVLALRRFPNMPVWPLPVVMAALGLVGYLSSGDLASVLVFASCWQINFASCAVGLLVFRPAAVPLVFVLAVSVSGGILLWLPSWGADLPVSIIITQLSIILALRYGVPPLFALAKHRDEEEHRSAEAIERAEIAQRTSRQIAEESRVLHDTAVNTLGAIANGGLGVSHADHVRMQCANDLRALEDLQGDRSGSRPAALQLIEALQSSWIMVRRSGASDEQLTQALSQVSIARLTGFAGAVREIVTNAAKHSGVPHLDASVRISGSRLSVEIRDDGVGFDAAAVDLRGLTHSVRERAELHGFSATVDSVPGGGTTAALALHLSQAATSTVPRVVPPPRVEDTIRSLQQRAALLWAGGVTMVSIVLSAANPANYRLSALLLIATMIISVLLIRFSPSQGGAFWSSMVLISAPSFIFVCAAATTEFGTSQAIHWQALAPTAPFVWLLAHRRRRGVWAATVLWILTATTVMFLGLPSTRDGLAIVATALAVGLGFALVWARFQTAVARLCFGTAAAEQRTFWANLDTSAARAAQRTYLRWIDTGLDSAMQLMRDIVEERRDARELETQIACGNEERYLRQVIQVGPQLIRLAPRLFPAMRRAHDQEIELTLRLGDQDAPDHDTARRIVGEVTAAIDTAAATDRVAVSLFPVHDGLQLTLVHTSGAPARPHTSQLLFHVPEETQAARSAAQHTE